MKNKKVISIIAIILTVLMVFSLVASVIPMAFAVSEEEISELKEKRNELSNQVYEQQQLVDKLEEEHADAIERKLAMDQRNDVYRQEIEVLQEEIDAYEKLIADKQLEVDAARALEAEQLEKYRIRVRAMEESGGYNILAIIFNSENFAELLAGIDDMNEIMESDRAIEEAYIEAREACEKVEAEYEEFKAGLEEDQQVLEEEQADLQKQIEEAEQLIEDLLASIDSEQEALDLITKAERAMETELANKIQQLEREKEAAKRAEEEEARRQQAAEQGGSSSSGGSGSSGTVVGTGSFAWPCSCTYITSCVGNRYHPISGEWKYHSGMDIGCSYGDSIWASDSGVVEIAGVNGGYGNCVMINHGNGYYTVYGHMSSVACSVGQSVSKGTVIGYVGSTGVSTGPHLHFEIRYGSNALDFADWFSGLTYAPDSGGAA